MCANEYMGHMSLPTHGILRNGNTLRTQHHPAILPCLLLVWIYASLLHVWHFELQRTDWPHELSSRHSTIVLVSVLLQFALFLCNLLLLSQRSFAWTADLACRSETWFRETLLRREILVFCQWTTVVCGKLVREELLDQADVRWKVLRRYFVVWFRRWKHDTRPDHNGLIVGIVRAVDAVLQQMQRNTERLEPELIRQAKLFEAEEILIDIFCKVTPNKLFAAVVEGSNTISASGVTKSGTLISVRRGKRLQQ